LLPIHPVGFLVITRQQVFGLPVSPEHAPRGQRLSCATFGLAPQQLLVTIIQPMQTEDGNMVRDMCGIVTALEGQPLPSGAIASRLGEFDDVQKLEESGKADAEIIETLIGSKNSLHNNYQDFDAFLKNGGRIGLQHDTLLYGAYVLVVLGAGPGGYTAAFRAADLGKAVALVERHSTLGGVCLNVGCIPSKTLLHMADVIDSASELREAGIHFGEPRLDLPAIRARKDAVVRTLSRGLSGLARQRGVRVLTRVGSFESASRISVQGSEGTTSVGFETRSSPPDPGPPGSRTSRRGSALDGLHRGWRSRRSRAGSW
jgi:hypothetical protein